jgi:hypothetical protein
MVPRVGPLTVFILEADKRIASTLPNLRLNRQRSTGSRLHLDRISAEGCNGVHLVRGAGHFEAQALSRKGNIQRVRPGSAYMKLSQDLNAR